MEKGLEEDKGEKERKVDRRKIVALATLAAAGLAVTSLTRKAHAQSDGQPLYVGQVNTAPDNAYTVLNAKVDGPGDAFSVLNKGAVTPGVLKWPSAIRGECPKGVGVWGNGGQGVLGEGWDNGVKGVSDTKIGVVGAGAQAGVYGHSGEGIGVYATSETGTALKVDGKSRCHAKIDSSPPVEGQPLPSAFTVENAGTQLQPPPTHHPIIGILGRCPQGIGVWAEGEIHGVMALSKSGPAVKAVSEGGGVFGGVIGAGAQAGVHGYSESGVGVGVRAESPTGTALQVDGRSQCHATVNTADVLPGHLPSAFSVTNEGVFNPELPDPKPPVAIVGHCPHGMGIAGFSDDNAAVHGNSTNNSGVYGYSDNDTGVWGWSPKGRGVYAKSETGTALKVEGKSSFTAAVKWPQHALEVHNEAEPIEGEGWVWPISIAGICDKGAGIVGAGSHMGVHGKTIGGTGTGVNGWSDSGTGVVGESKDGIGVLAISKGSPALRVEGKSSFSTVGSGTIPALKKSYSVELPLGLVTDKSHISVMLTSDPNAIGDNAAVSFVVRDPAKNRFTINLTKRVGRDTTFTYFIVEP